MISSVPALAAAKGNSKSHTAKYQLSHHHRVLTPPPPPSFKEIQYLFPKYILDAIYARLKKIKMAGLPN